MIRNFYPAPQDTDYAWKIIAQKPNRVNILVPDPIETEFYDSVGTKRGKTPHLNEKSSTGSNKWRLKW